MSTASRPLVTKLGPMSSSKGIRVGPMIPRKQTNEDAVMTRIKKTRVQSIAFRKPPPPPPVLGPLFALSILELLKQEDKDDD